MGRARVKSGIEDASKAGLAAIGAMQFRELPIRSPPMRRAINYDLASYAIAEYATFLRVTKHFSNRDVAQSS